jgi:hypothetical protein
MLIGFPNVSRGPGFLGSTYGNIYLTDLKTGPAGFTRPDHLTEKRISDRKKLLEALEKQSPKGSPLAEYQKAQTEALRLAGPGFMKNFDLASEPDSLLNRYQSEFGQRCLLARRLVQDGVRFIERSHNPGFPQRHRLGHPRQRPTQATRTHPRPRQRHRHPHGRP